MAYPEKGSGKGKEGSGKSKEGSGKGKPGKGSVMGQRGKFAFKVLCPDSLVSVVMGRRGSYKDKLQEETGCKLVLSNRGEYFPGTDLRILVVYGPDPGAVLGVLEKVLDKLVECGETELQQGAKAEQPDFLGKEDGEYIFRGAVSSKMVPSLIGTKGSNVQTIRIQTNVKVFIDSEQFQGHQVMKVIGSVISLRKALRLINVWAHISADELWFAEWSMIRNITEAGESSAKGYQRSGGHRERERSPRRTSDNRHWQGGAWEESRSAGKGHSAYSDKHAAVDSVVADGDGPAPICDTPSLAHTMAGVFRELSLEPIVLGKEFTITCEFPSKNVSALIGKRGEHVELVRRQTDAIINFELENKESQTQTLTLKGPAWSVYLAHALMIKRYWETEQPVQLEQSPELISELQGQIEALQQQLAAASGGSSKTRQ